MRGVRLGTLWADLGLASFAAKQGDLEDAFMTVTKGRVQ